MQTLTRVVYVFVALYSDGHTEAQKRRQKVYKLSTYNRRDDWKQDDERTVFLQDTKLLLPRHRAELGAAAGQPKETVQRARLDSPPLARSEQQVANLAPS